MALTIGSLFSKALGTPLELGGRAAWRTLKSGPLGKGLAGAGIGGVYAGLTGPEDMTPEARLKHIMMGAGIGGTLGAGAGLIRRPSLETMKKMGLGVKDWALSSSSMLKKAGKWALENPTPAFAAGLGIMALPSLPGMIRGAEDLGTGLQEARAQSRAANVRTSVNQQALMLQELQGSLGTGINQSLSIGQFAQPSRNDAFANSTHGLVQGLHRRRHG